MPAGGGVIAPPAPADFFVTLQGQTAQNSSTFRPTPGDPSYNIPNEGSIYVGWPDAIPGDFPSGHYEVQHSIDNGANWVTPTGGGAISLAAADSQGTRFKDLNCSNGVSTVYGPTAGRYLDATDYLHRLRVVDSQGTPSAWVVGAKQYFYNGLTGGKSVVTPSGSNTGVGGGFKWVGDLSSGYPTNYAVADPTYGFVATIDMSAAGGGYWLPTTGCNYCTFNQRIGVCDYMYVVLKTTNAAMNISMHSEVVGDLPMRPGGAPPANLNGGTDLKLSAYVVGGVVLANTYQTYKIPMTDFMVPQAGFGGSATAIGIQQKSFYKFLWQANASAIVTIALGWFGK